MKKLTTIFLTLFLCFSVQARQEITIVRGQDFPPYHYTDNSHGEAGFVIETINAVARSMDLKVTYRQYPWSRCITMVRLGQADAMMNLFPTDDRKKFMDFSNNIIAFETNTFFALKNRAIQYNGDFQTIKQYRIATIRNYSYGARFDSFHFPRNFHMETENELINSLINQRCEIIIANKLVTRVLIRSRKLMDRIGELAPDISREPLYIGFSKIKGHESLSRSFSDHLHQFKSSKTYQHIIEFYGLSP